MSNGTNKAARISIIVLIIAAIFALVGIFRHQIIDILSRALSGDNSLKAYMQGLGTLGYFIMIFLQFLQVVITVLPSDPIMIASGVGYGAILGSLWCAIGAALGGQFIFFFHRFLHSSEKAKRERAEIEQKAKDSGKNIWVLFALLYLCPGIPFGLIAIVSLSFGTKWWKHAVITSIGPLIPISFTVTIGSILGKTDTNPVLSYIFFIIVLIIIIFALFNKKKLVNFILRPKKTVEQKIDSMKLKKPKKWIYWLFMPIFRRKVFNKNNARVLYETDIKNLKPPFLVLTSHPSRKDYVYYAMAMQPHRMSIVINRYYYHNRLLRPLLKKAGAIPTKLFQPDMSAMREILRAKKDGRIICMTPEGFNSISGESQDLIPSVAKLVKHLKMPVVGVVINGAFLTEAKWRSKEKPRTGRVDITVKELFSTEQVTSLSQDEIFDTMKKELYYNDFDWASKNKVEFSGGNLASRIEYVIYRCPKCGAERRIKSEGDKFWCEECGNGASINKYYEIEPLDECSQIPASIAEWYKTQEEAMRQEIQADEFKMQEDVELLMFSGKKSKETVVGKGELALTKAGLSYTSTSGYELELNIPTANLPAIVQNSKNLGLYYNDEYFCFKTQELTLSKWAIAVKEIHKNQSQKEKST